MENEIEASPAEGGTGISIEAHVHDELVRACDEREAVRAQELVGHVGAPREPGAARRRAPTVALLGVRPEQIAHEALESGVKTTFPSRRIR